MQGRSAGVRSQVLGAAVAAAMMMGTCCAWGQVDQIYYWDTNGATAGAGGAAPTGTWDGVNAFFTTDSTGGSATFAWPNDSVGPGRDDVYFAAGSDATGAYSVVISGTRYTRRFFLEEGNLTLTTTGGTPRLDFGSNTNPNDFGNGFYIAPGSTVNVSSVTIGRSSAGNPHNFFYKGTTLAGGNDEGRLIVNAANIEHGNLIVLNGVFDLGTSITTAKRTGLGGGGSASVFQGSGTLNKDLGQGPGLFDWTAASSVGGFAARGGPLTVTLDGAGTLLTWGAWSAATPFVGTGFMILGSVSADDVVTLTNPMGLNGGVRTIKVIDNPNSSNDKAILGGAIAGGLPTTGLIKTGDGILELTNTSTYIGPTTISAGTFRVTGSIAASTAVVVIAGATLEGCGTASLVSGIRGSGLVSPGASAGILTAAAVNPTNGLDFAFELCRTGSPVYASATASTNDVLRLTNAAPFTAALGATNVVRVYFKVPTLVGGDVFRGAWYTDQAADFYGSISGASNEFYVLGDGGGSYAFNGVNYYKVSESMPQLLGIVVSTVPETANFGGGPVNGYVTQIEVPQPGTLASIAVGLALLLGRRRRVS